MTLLRFFGYLTAALAFLYVGTKSLVLLSASSDTLVAIGVGSLLGLAFLGAEFIKYVIHDLKKEKTV